MAENAPKTAGSEIRDAASRATAGMSDNPAKFEETWKSWEHLVDVYENLSSSKLDDDVKISVVLREALQKLRDRLLVNSQQFESNNNKLRAIIQAHLNTNKTWIVNDFRENRSNGGGITQARTKAKAKAKARARAKATAKAKARENLTTTQSATCAERRSLRTRLLVTSQPRQDGERGRS